MFSEVSKKARFVKGKPCGSCPWRKLKSNHSPEQVTVLAPCSRNESLQGCHQAPDTICRGFSISVGRRDALIALQAAMSGVDLFRDVKSDEPLFESWGEVFESVGLETP